VGLTVYDEEDNELGTVENVLRTGSNDVYAVRSEDGREILIPALRKAVRTIDVPNGRMTVRLSE